jgi:hypothetical protein
MGPPLASAAGDASHSFATPADAILIWRWRDGRVAEGARLESVFTLTGNVGSNPTLSATPSCKTLKTREKSMFMRIFDAFRIVRHVR